MPVGQSRHSDMASLYHKGSCLSGAACPSAVAGASGPSVAEKPVSGVWLVTWQKEVGSGESRTAHNSSAPK